MNRYQKRELRELKQRNKFMQRCNRENARHNRRMNVPAQLLPRVAVAWISCYFVCASCAVIFSGALVVMVAS